jgi:NAD(P)-dependent dehydrogenase (short-subunit alcohol dehydrogenase family)
MAINLESVGLLTKLGIEHFKKRGGGRFVYISSRAAFRGETEDYLAYAASKGGLTSLARSVARSFGKYNIKAFVLAPGFTRTEMAEGVIDKLGEEKVLNELALKELTTPEDIAPIVVLMCSGQMDHATGSTIDFNAGSYIR